MPSYQMRDAKRLLGRAYALFNERDIEGVLKLMHPDVDWPHGMEGGYVHGHEAVREYWTRQFGMIDSSVTPTGYSFNPDGRIVVSVQQVVRNLDGTLISEQMVEHVYLIADGLVEHMEIRPAEE